MHEKPLECTQNHLNARKTTYMHANARHLKKRWRALAFIGVHLRAFAFIGVHLRAPKISCVHFPIERRFLPSPVEASICNEQMDGRFATIIT